MRARERRWLDRGSHALLCHVHQQVPDADVHSLVVLAGPVGREAVTAHRTMLALAEHLAGLGHRVVRPTTRTTLGDDDPQELPDSWRDDLLAAVDLGLAGGEAPVDLVGLRLGAALAATVEHPRLRHRLLWEPVGGAELVRHGRAVRRLTLPGPTLPDVVELGGTTWTQAQAASVRALPDPRHLPGVTLLEPEPPEVVEGLYGPDPLQARVPQASLARIGELLAGPAAGLPPVPGAAAPVRRGGMLHEVVQVGPARLPGLLVSPAGEVTGVVLVAALGAESSLSATSPWAPLHALTGQGYAVLHVDRPPHGELADPGVAAEPHPYRPESVTALEQAVAWAHERFGADVPVHGVGACAGAWALLRAARTSSFASLWALNNRAWHPDRRHYDLLFARRRRRQALGLSVPTGTAPASRRQRLARAVRQAQHRSREAVPLGLLRRAARRGLASYAGVLLEDAAPHIPVRLVLGPEDHDLFVALRGPAAVARLAAAGRDVQVVRVDALDHSLLTEAARRAAAQAVLDGIRAWPALRRAA